ncbi:hypothetical protein LPB136_06270 [Tenacibaculum todarodis]|uniref:Lipid/polyisoprenoid-binding YceI-like domain-containing protein n=1 Tax=Tenacibaculum todarodis TaxID=1850252 RepID=A0A1L3JIR1_9FLAO|nr:DUF6263 family protein [Tenacibaculum todarodis]APG64982.1 hypothetical protein LPB136_06270 [Tenacibaculum todarodis]
MKKFLILVLVIASSLTFAQESVLLRLKYNKGDKYAFKMKQTLDSSVGMKATNIDMISKITDVSNDLFTSETKIDKMKIDTDIGLFPVSFDSSKEDSELDEIGLMLKQQMSPMLQMIITTKSNVHGKVMDVKVTPDSPMTAQFKNQFNVVFPEKPVKVGDTWIDETAQQGLKNVIEYKVTSITSEKVVLTLTGNVTGQATGTATSGSVEIDRASGALLKSLINNNINAGGQEVKVGIELTMEKI